MTFINLPVKDLDRALAFFDRLGITGEEPSPDGTSAQLAISDTTYLILHTESAFTGYTGTAVADASKGREVVVGLTTETREQVDDLVERAVAAGGEALGEAQDQGHMYMRGFRDLDGH